MTSISKAVELLGGPGAASLRLACSQQAISFWINGKRTPSVEVCIAIERETAGAVKVEDLRPDIDWSVIRGPASPAGAMVAPQASDAHPNPSEAVGT